MAITYSLVATDWTVNNITGEIHYTGDDHNGTSPSYATVIELHRWLGQLSDDSTPADTSDKMYIPIPKASERSTDNIITMVNGFYCTAAAIEHLYDGSIIQNGGDDIFDGIVNFGNASVQIQIIQNGAILSDDFWNYNYGAVADSGSGTTLTDTGFFTGNDWSGYTFKNTTDACQGIATSNTDDTVTFASGELYGTGTKDFATSDNYLIGQPLNPDAAQGISHRFLIQTRKDGADIDGRRLIGICRRPGNTFAWFPINGTSRGNNVLALSDAADLNYDESNQTVMGTTWDTDFSGEDQGFQQFDVDDDSTDEDYYGKLTWSSTHDINDLYMRAMGETCDNGGYTVHGLDGEVLRGVTNYVGYDNDATITWATPGVSYDQLSWGTYINVDTPTGSFSVGEVIVDADPAGSTTDPTFYATIISIDTSDTTGGGAQSLVVDIDSGTLGNGTTIYGVTSGADADTVADPTEETGGGLVHILANDTTNDIIYYQILKGTALTNNTRMYYCGTTPASATHTDICDIDTTTTTATEIALSKTAPYIGVSTGSAIIGAYGVGIDNLKLQDTDSVIPLGTTTPISPPLSVTNTLSGVISGEDYCLVAPTDGITTDINGDAPIGAAYFTIQTALTGAAVTSVVVQEDLDEGTGKIDGFLPSSGYISIVNDEGIVVDHPYSAYVGATNTFTITSYDFSGSGVNDSVSIGNYAYVYQMYVDTALTGATETAVSVNDIIGSTPNSGTIRVVNDEGFHIQCWYSSYSDSTNDFTLVSTDTFVDGDVTVGTDNIASTSHGLQDQMIVQLTTTGTLPTGLSTGTDYWVIYVDADNFKLAADLDDCFSDTAVDITAASGGGTHTVTPKCHIWNGTGLTDSAGIGSGAYVSYIDKLADGAASGSTTTEEFTSVYDNDLELTSVVRDGGSTPIKEDKKRWTLTNSAATLGVTRTSDT